MDKVVNETKKKKKEKESASSLSGDSVLQWLPKICQELV
jgi:hypothetical protein